MVRGPRALLGRLALLAGISVVAFSCDAGGLLVVEGNGVKDLPRVDPGPPATELVSAGTFASNGQYRLFYVVGQPTPNQNVATATGQRLNGGLTGAVHPQ